MNFIRAFSFWLLKFCKFIIPDTKIKPQPNIIRFTLIQIFLVVLYYIVLLISCLMNCLPPLIDFSAWFLSLFISISELYKRNIIGHNKLKAIKEQMKNSNNVKKQVRFYNQFYVCSFKTSALLVTLSIIIRATYEIAKLLFATPVTFIKVLLEIFMIVSMVIIVCQTIILSLVDYYEAEDIF